MAEELRPDPRAHLKQQPALFDIKQVKPKPELRYQRGYTPERMREVRGTTEGITTVPHYGGVEPNKKVPCQTCGGKGHSPSFQIKPGMLDNPDMQAHWKNRGIVHNGVIASAPGQECWSCGGKGNVPAEVESARGMGQNVDHPFYQPHGVRMIQEGIARSTVPVEHLGGLHHIELMPERKLGVQGMAGTMGLYTKGTVRMFPQPAASPKRGRFAGQRVMEEMGQVQPLHSQLFGATKRKTPVSEMIPVSRPSQRQKAEGTLIHEIGHHVSQGKPGPPEEARADRYMVEHWRPDPRDVCKRQDINIERTTYLHRLGGPYSASQFEQAGVPTPQPKGRRRKS